MSQKSHQEPRQWIRNPRGDDHPFWDMIMGIYAYQSVLVSHELKLFPLLAASPLTLGEISETLKIAARPAEALLAVCLSLGLLRLHNGRYGLTPLCEDYLLEESPTYFGAFLDYTLANGTVITVEGLKRAVRTNTQQVYGGEDLYRIHKEQADLANSFTAMMHSHSMAAALAWPGKIDLSGHARLLDIGGGSGAHSLGALQRWPNLRATILDLAPVCEAAKWYLGQYGPGERVNTLAADMWTDPFPAADLHFYADIYHDFTPEKCLFLSQKSFGSLNSGGRIIVHEMLFNDAKDGPLTVAGYSVSMLLWTEGQQFSGTELSALLATAGFIDIEVMPTAGYWGIVTGRKP